MPITDGVKPAEIVAVVGGLVDESRVSLAIYGENLDPHRVTEALGVVPTSAHRRGERRGPRSPPYAQGAWLLEETGEAPIGPEELLGRLLRRLPDPGSPMWEQLRERCDVQLRFGLFMNTWSRGFGLSAELLARLARIGCELEFDIYADTDGS